MIFIFSNRAKKYKHRTLARMSGLSPLTRAITNCRLDEAEMLLKNGAKVNEINVIGGTTALQVAIYSGNVPAVKLLLRHNADVSTDGVARAVCRDIESGTLEIAELVIRAGCQNKTRMHRNESRMHRNESRMHKILQTAVRVDNVHLATLLLDAGADVNYQSEWDYPHLSAAKSPEMVEMLLQRNANVHLQATVGFAKLRPLHIHARRFRSAKILNLLLAKGAYVDILDRQRRSALMHASAVGCEENIACLLAAGANPNICAKDGRFKHTCLHLLVESNYGDISGAILKLIDAGADVNAVSAGKTVLLSALSDLGTVSLDKFGLEILLNNGAMLKCRDRKTNSDLWDIYSRQEDPFFAAKAMRQCAARREYERLVNLAVLLRPLGLPVLVVYNIYRTLPHYASHLVPRYQAWNILKGIQ